MHVLTLNAGSGTLKAAWFTHPSGSLGEPATPDWATTIPAADGGHGDATRALLDGWDRPVDAVAHRVVHGGPTLRAAAPLDPDLVTALEQSVELAPLHGRPALDVIDTTQRALPHAAHVVVPDTAFHRTLPPAAATYAGPARWRDLGYVRYGFHGLAHQYATHRVATVLGRPVEDLHVLSCHFGGGCSLAAVDRGRSVDTTMGFTPLEGLAMATRSGSIDPGLVLHLLRDGMSRDELEYVLHRASGLLGLSGVSADLAEVVAAADAGHAHATLAVDVYRHRIRADAAAMLASLPGLDASVVSGGVGEHVPLVADTIRDLLRRFEFDAPVLVEAAREDWVLALSGAEVAADQRA